jgi:menaquinone-9 beta-reductase
MDVGLEMADHHFKKLKMPEQYDVVIVGGGLAGLVAANILSRKNTNVLLIEKNNYPFHKVCGEYISNEVVPFLSSLGLNIESLNVSRINELYISTPGRNSLKVNLDLGGFGVSRFNLDNSLYQSALNNNAKIITGKKVQDISFAENEFTVLLNDSREIKSKIVIGSYGKREILDKALGRDFIKKHTGYMAVKYHIRSKYPVNRIGLYLFKDGYCGLVKIEEDKYCLCYLTKRSNMKGYKTIQEMEEKVLYKNPLLRDVFRDSEFIYDKPEVINEISFARKNSVEDHVLMCGDTAGLITPLCGNGMSMAIRSAAIACEEISKSGILDIHVITEKKRAEMERNYKNAWSAEFSNRLLAGKMIQEIFNQSLFANLSLGILKKTPSLSRWLIRQTHGKILNVLTT